MAFLDKLKRRVDVIEQTKTAEAEKEKEKEPEKSPVDSGSNYAQLDVDIHESPSKFIILCDTYGVELNNLDISIGDDNDVLIIQGKRISPIDKLKETETNIAQHHLECKWGEFYRQIILPQEVNPDQIDAYEEKGVLVITLPILRLVKGKKSIKVKMKS